MTGDRPSAADGTNDEAAIGVATFLLSLRAKGIRDRDVLRAMELVPRDAFAPRRFADLARSDIALPLPCGQTMTAPGSVAAMLAALGVKPGQRVYEIGTGSGYVSALLVRLGAEVVSTERCAALAEEAAGRLRALGSAGVTVEHADGLARRPRERFDRVILNGTVATMPETVLALLGPGGRLVGATAGEDGPRLVQVERTAEGETRQEGGSRLRISPLVVTG